MMSGSQSPSVRGWIVVFAGFCVNLLIGPHYSWGVIGKALVTQWHWTKTQAAMPFAVATVAFAITMVFAGRAQDKLGPRRVATLGGVVFGLGMISSSFATSPMTLVLTFGVLAGAGIGLSYSATTPAAVKWFPASRKGLITGIVVSGIGVAAVFMAPLAQLLLARTSISTTFLILGLGLAVLILLLAQLLTDPPQGFVPAAHAVTAPHHASPKRLSLDWHEVVRTPQFYLLWLMYVLTASAGLLVISNAPIIAKEQAKWEAGFVLLMLLAVFNTLGRFISGALSDRLGRSTTMLITFVIQAADLFMFSHYRSPMSLAFGTALLGLCYGTLYTLMPAITADFYGLRNMGVNYGLVFTGVGVAGVLGSVIGGRVRDLFGSYHMAYLICGVMLMLAVVLACFLRAPRVEEACAESLAPEIV